MADLKSAAQTRFNELARGSKIGIPSGKFRWAFKSTTGSSDEEIARVFSILDGDGNGYVNLDEFLKWVEDPSNSELARLYLGLGNGAAATGPAQNASSKPAATQPVEHQTHQPQAPNASAAGRAPAVPGRRRSITGMRPPDAAEIFALLDTNGDRFVDFDEWSVFNDLARRLSPELATQVMTPRDGAAGGGFKAADVDGSGCIDEKEWMEYTSAIVTIIGERAWEAAAAKVKKELHAKLKAGPAHVKGVNPMVQKINYKVKTATVENHLITLAEAKHIAKELKSGTEENCILTLNFKKTMTDGTDACRELAAGVANATGLRDIFVDNVQIARKNILFEGTESRGEFRDDRKITSLDWTKIGFDTSDGDDLLVFMLSEMLKDKRCCLQDLKLHPKQLGIDASYALGEALRVNRTLKYVRLGANLPYEAIRNSSIDEIDWTSKDINSCDVIVLVSLLKDNKSVRALKLSGNDICFNGVNMLCEFLKTTKNIMALDLSLNPRLGDDSMMPMKDMLLVNKTLQVLMLKGTGIGENGAMSLASALPKSGVKKLHLEYNKIGGLGCKKLAEAVDTSSQLQELHLENNQIPPAVKTQCGADAKRVFF